MWNLNREEEERGRGEGREGEGKGEEGERREREEKRDFQEVKQKCGIFILSIQTNLPSLDSTHSISFTLSQSQIKFILFIHLLFSISLLSFVFLFSPLIFLSKELHLIKAELIQLSKLIFCCFVMREREKNQLDGNICE